MPATGGGRVSAKHMARIEPIRYGILKLRDTEPSPMRLSHAARFEDPDLGYTGPACSLQGLSSLPTEDKEPLTLSGLRAEKRLVEGASPAFLLCVISQPSTPDSVFLFCRYPLKGLADLDLPGVAAPSPDAGYVEALRRNNAALDPLVLGVPGLKAATVASLSKLGEEVHVCKLTQGRTVTLRAITSDKDQKAALKAFDAGRAMPRQGPLLLDGPFELVRWQKGANVPAAFACLVPIGEGMNALRLNELLLYKAHEPAQDEASVPAPGTGAVLNLDAETQARVKLRRYPYSSEGSKEYARLDWEED